MVSQSDHSTSLALRGAAASVASRPSLSRTKRYNRSHTGGVAFVPQNEFPVFSHSGDVEILVKAGGHENRYVLHKHTLTRCSGFFEASTSQEWSKSPQGAATTELARLGGNIDHDEAHSMIDSSASKPASATRCRWRYELDSGADHGDIPMLVQKDCDMQNALAGNALSIFGEANSSGTSAANGKESIGRSISTRSNRSFSRSVINLSIMPRGSTAPPLSQADQELLRDYDNLFRIFYNYPPLLDGINIADAYVQCKSLLTLADQYDALTVVGPRVDHHLLQFQSRLWKQVAKYPISYLRLGYLARSKIIFQEALIHVVGQWPAGERSLRSALPSVVLDMIEDKVDEMEELVSRVEGRLFRLNLTTARGERVTPATSLVEWLAVSLFRQWLADNTSPPNDDRHSTVSRNERSPPASALSPLASIGRTYRVLGSGNSAAYLGHDECKRFLKLNQELYSRDNLRRFEKRMDELKAMARDIVRPLMGSGLELDMGSSGRADGITYLTCTSVSDRDLPWPMES